MSLVLQVDILGEFKNLTAATKGAQSQLSSLNKRAQGISRSMNKAFAAIGIGLSLGILKRELEEASKAAVEDAKSQKILALAMENTGKATSLQVKQAEKAIGKMQISAAVADDKIRPAYQKLFIATGDVTKANHLMQVALDTAAFSGKDLSTVSQAMAKSLAGSDTALVKLIPSLKGVKDPMGELEKMTLGAAEAAADLDPYARMQQIFSELQEQVGFALLPILNRFSDWLATPEGTAKLQAIVEGFVTIITEGTKLVDWAITNKDWLVPMAAAIGGLVVTWKLVTTAISVADTAQKLFSANAVTNAGVAMKAWAPLAALLGVVAVSDWASKTLQTSTPASKRAIGGAFSLNSTASASAGGSNMSFSKPKTSSNITINTYNSNLTASDIVNKLNKAAKTNGGIGAAW